MFVCRTLRRQRFLVVHREPTNPSQHLVETCFGHLGNNLQSSLHRSTNPRFVSASAQFEPQGEISGESNISSENGDLADKKAKSYDVLFKEAVGFIERTGDLRGGDEVGNGGCGDLSSRLRDLELELKELREKSGGIDPKLNSGGRRRRRKVIGRVVEKDASKPKPNPVSCLYSLFDHEGSKKEKELEKKESLVGRKMSIYELGKKSGGIRERAAQNEGGRSKEESSSTSLFDKKKGVEKYNKELDEAEDLLVKELSPEMEVFVRHLYDEGYFRDANFLPGNRFDVKGFESAYAQDFLKSAAVKFGRDKQEIAKWLSGSNLKALAIFGCPSVSKRTVFAAKSLRTFFQIPENTVCSKCVLRESCKFVNQSVWKSGSKNLNLSSLMRLLTVYALEATPPPLVLSEDIKACVKRLMKDVINLSKTVDDAA